MFLKHADKLIANTMQQVYIEDPSFITTEEYLDIEMRCFRLHPDFLDSVEAVLTSYRPRRNNVETIERFGCWDEDNFRILSDLYLSHFMRVRRVVDQAPPIDFTAKDAIEKISNSPWKILKKKISMIKS